MLLQLKTLNNCTYWALFFKPVCQRFIRYGQKEILISIFLGMPGTTDILILLKKFKHIMNLPGVEVLVKGLFDEKGNWHGLYALVFLIHTAMLSLLLAMLI